MVCSGMARPQIVFTKDKKGNPRLTRDYKAYLSNELRMTADERSMWGNLGVHITRERERRIVGFFCAVDFLEQPFNGNGGG